MDNLLSKRCASCEVGIPPLDGSVLGELLSQLHADWELIDEDGKLRREFRFKDFKDGVFFINKVAALAEAEGHHPDIHLVSYQNVILELWTHKIGGLSESDFILAAKIDQIQ